MIYTKEDMNFIYKIKYKSNKISFEIKEGYYIDLSDKLEFMYYIINSKNYVEE